MRKGLLADGQTPCERRFNSPFEGPIVPLAAKVKFDAISSQDQGRVHKFGTKVLPEKYGRRLERGWKLDCLLIVDTEDLKTMPPSEIHITNHSKSKDARVGNDAKLVHSALCTRMRVVFSRIRLELKTSV